MYINIFENERDGGGGEREKQSTTSLPFAILPFAHRLINMMLFIPSSLYVYIGFFSSSNGTHVQNGLTNSYTHTRTSTHTQFVQNYHMVKTREAHAQIVLLNRRVHMYGGQEGTH